MRQVNENQLGYFITKRIWKDALLLLNFQIAQKKRNRHFNTLSMFYYEKLDVSCLVNSDDYFDSRIASSLFYGLEKEFSVISYVIPKTTGLGLRDYKFFTYPMKAVYYAIGLYILRLSEVFLNETYKQVKDIRGFYGGNLHYKGEDLQLSSKKADSSNVYYRKFHKKFQREVSIEAKSRNENKVILSLDIENYFNEVSVQILLELLDQFIKPSVKAKMWFNAFTKEQILSFFNFISNGKGGIPQSHNNIISGFLGYLYLSFGDLFIDDVLNSYNDVITSHKIIRYVDDVHISMTFIPGITAEKLERLINSIASQIAEVLYSRLDLKLNMKTEIYWPAKKLDRERLLKAIKYSSPSNEYFRAAQEDEEENEDSKDESDEESTSLPQKKLDNIFEELRRIKKISIEGYLKKGIDDEQVNVLQDVFDRGVEGILNKEENKNEIGKIFKDFNFDLIKIRPLPMLVLILRNDFSKSEFRDFCLNKRIITIWDADLILNFLCQTDFEDEKLLRKLEQNLHMRAIVSMFLNAKLHCDVPGCYTLSCLQAKRLVDMPDVIEQTKLRVVSERSGLYSVAMNHLVNEIHAVCIHQEEASSRKTVDKKSYKANNVVDFVSKKGVDHETCIKIRNLFDRRNSNQVSHPGSSSSLAWVVSKEEYLDYYEHVGICMKHLL